MISFHISASYGSYLFDQLNLAFKCSLINAGFLAVMHPFSSCSQMMHLAESTDTKLDKFHLSFTCFAVFLG